MKERIEYRFKNEELEQDLQAIGEEGRTYAIELAKDNASLNQPKSDSSGKPFVGLLTSFFNKGVGLIRTALHSAMSKFDLESERQLVEDQKDTLGKEVNQLQNDLRLKQREKQKSEEKGNAPVRRNARWKKLRVFNMGVILLDVAISSSAFQSMGYNLLVSLAIGFGLGIAIYLLSEHFPEILEKGKTRGQRITITVLVYASLTIVFYVIGIFRAKGLIDNEGFVTSPWYFCIMNLFFFSVASTVSILNKPSKAERKQLDAWKTLLQDIKEAKTKKAKLEQRIVNLQSEFNDKKETREKLILYASDMEALLVTFYEDAVQMYVSTNVQNRSDGIIPKCFEENPPILNLHFNNQKFSSNEK